MNITPIVNAVIALAAAVVTAFVVPWIKSKTTAAQREEIDEESVDLMIESAVKNMNEAFKEV